MIEEEEHVPTPPGVVALLVIVAILTLVGVVLVATLTTESVSPLYGAMLSDGETLRLKSVIGKLRMLSVSVAVLGIGAAFGGYVVWVKDDRGRTAGALIAAGLIGVATSGWALFAAQNVLVSVR